MAGDKEGIWDEVELATLSTDDVDLTGLGAAGVGVGVGVGVGSSFSMTIRIALLLILSWRLVFISGMSIELLHCTTTSAEGLISRI